MTSPSAAERLWPYTMDYGLPQARTPCRPSPSLASGTAWRGSCARGASGGRSLAACPRRYPTPGCLPGCRCPQDCSVSTGACSTDERHPGLWEFPMWNVQDATGVTLASMDPTVRWEGPVERQPEERTARGAMSVVGFAASMLPTVPVPGPTCRATRTSCTSCSLTSATAGATRLCPSHGGSCQPFQHACPPCALCRMPSVANISTPAATPPPLPAAATAPRWASTCTPPGSSLMAGGGPQLCAHPVGHSCAQPGPAHRRTSSRPFQSAAHHHTRSAAICRHRHLGPALQPRRPPERLPRVRHVPRQRLPGHRLSGRQRLGGAPASSSLLRPQAPAMRAALHSHPRRPLSLAASQCHSCRCWTG